MIEGEYAGKIVAVAVGGVGRAARRAADVLIAGHRPALDRLGRVCRRSESSLRPQRPGPAHEVIDPEGHRFPVAIPGSLAQQSRTRPRPAAHGRPDRPEPEEKQELRRGFEADLVDMESSAVAALCSEKLVRFLSVRVISDDARTDSASRGGHASVPYGQLSGRGGDACLVAATLQSQGFLDAARAGPRSVRPAREVLGSVPR